MAPFVLQFGKFSGRAIEAMMFDPEGYEFLRQYARQKETSGNVNFLRRVRGLLQKGENPEIKAICACGKKVVSVIGKYDNSGVSFSRFVCEDCAKKIFAAENEYPLKFSAMVQFKGSERRNFLFQLRQACGFKFGERITAQKAHDFFYPPKLAEQKVKPRQRELPWL